MAEINFSDLFGCISDRVDDLNVDLNMLPRLELPAEVPQQQEFTFTPAARVSVIQHSPRTVTMIPMKKIGNGDEDVLITDAKAGPSSTRMQTVTSRTSQHVYCIFKPS